MDQVSIIPLFVVDRPASLRILAGIDKSHKFGILSHPYTTENFKEQFSRIECGLKICDSGIYQHKAMNYKRLFTEYKRMHADFGIIKDYYRDRAKTMESAKRGYCIYKKYGFDRDFKLIGVAQGNSVAEYLRSYSEQREIGFATIAIGGLLEKMPPEIKIAMVRAKGEVFIRNVLQAVRQKYPEDNLFPLGVLNKRRIPFFRQINVSISDYKGWIFRYDKEQSEMKNDRFEQIRKYITQELFPAIESEDNSRQSKSTVSRKPKEKLLIMACGKSKTETPGKAINVYQGQSFRMVRKYLEQNNHIDIKIISAKYGLLDFRDRIYPYDLKMNKLNSSIYREAYFNHLSELAINHENIFVIGGKNYKSILPPKYWESCAKGKIGEQLSQLKQWLYS